MHPGSITDILSIAAFLWYPVGDLDRDHMAKKVFTIHLSGPLQKKPSRFLLAGKSIHTYILINTICI